MKFLFHCPYTEKMGNHNYKVKHVIFWTWPQEHLKGLRWYFLVLQTQLLNPQNLYKFENKLFLVVKPFAEMAHAHEVSWNPRVDYFHVNFCLIQIDPQSFCWSSDWKNTQGRKVGLWTPEFSAYYGSDFKTGTGEFFWNSWTSSFSYIRNFSSCLITTSSSLLLLLYYYFHYLLHPDWVSYQLQPTE